MKKIHSIMITLLLITSAISITPLNSINAETQVGVDGSSVENQPNSEDGGLKSVDEFGNITTMEVTLVNQELLNSVEGVITPEQNAFAAAIGVVNFKTKPSANVITSYIDSNGKAGYLNGYYGIDAAFLGFDGSKAKFMMAGVIGYVDKYDKDGNLNYQVLDYSNQTLVKTVSVYIPSNGFILHKLAKDVNILNSYQSTLNIGEKPSYMMDNVPYYSYDGHYFYLDYATMINDYVAGIRTNSVNPSNPYYSYYQFLSNRSKTTLGSADLDYLISMKTIDSSKMRGLGKSLIDNQNKYGANALLVAAVAANESAWGTSPLAKNNNNLFGHNAYDSNPGQADKYDTTNEAVVAHTKNFLSIGMFDPCDNYDTKNNGFNTNYCLTGRYYGAHLGDKSSGLNVKYASDPYWGEKASNLARALDVNANDTNASIVGIKTGFANLNIMKEPSKNSLLLYQTGTASHFSLQVIDTVSGDDFAGSNIWYKVQSDPTLNSARSIMTQDIGNYDYANMYGYVHSSEIIITNDSITTTPSLSNIKVGSVDATGYTVSATIENKDQVGSIQFPTWTELNGQDDLFWGTGSITGNTVSYRVKTSDHKNEGGAYVTHIHLKDKAGKTTQYTVTPNTEVPSIKPALSNIKVGSVDATGYTVSATIENKDQVGSIQFPTWTELNGQDDLFWGTGSITGNTVSYRVKTSDHKNEGGAYVTHIHLKDKAGKTTQYTVTPNTEVPSIKPALSNIKVGSVDATGYTVSATIENKDQVGSIQFPTWTELNGQDDLFWGTGSITGNTVSYRVKTSDHKNEGGAYVTHIHLKDKAGKTTQYTVTPNTEVPSIKPALSNIKVGSVDATGYTVSATIENKDQVGSIQFPTWTELNGQDDLFWGTGSITGNTVSYRVKTSDHKNEGGAYVTHIHLKDKAGKTTQYTVTPNTEVPSIKPALSNIKVGSVDATGYTVSATIENKDQVGSIQFPTWTELNGQDDLFWGTGSITGNTVSYRVKTSDHKNEGGAYVTHIHLKDKAGKTTQYTVTPNTEVPSIKPALSNIKVGSVDATGYTVSATIENKDQVGSIQFPTWTELNGQDDLFWGTGSITGNAVSYRVKTSDHKNEGGAYVTHIHLKDKAGKTTQYTVTPNTEVPSIKPALSNIKVGSVDATGYTVSATIENKDQVGSIQFPTWTELNGQDDLFWGTGSITGNTVSYRVKTSDHKNEGGAYVTHIHLKDKAGKTTQYTVTPNTVVLTTKPQIDSIKIYDIDETGYTISCNVDAAGGVSQVRFAVWSLIADQDDLLWNDGSINGNTVSYRVKTSDHNNDLGDYTVHIYAYGKSGQQSMKVAPTTRINTENLTIGNVYVKNITPDGYDISAIITGAHEITSIQFPTWTESNGQDDLIWHNGKMDGTTATFRVKASDHNYEKGNYITHIHVKDSTGKKVEKNGAIQYVNALSKYDGWVSSNGQKYFYNSNGQLIGNGPSRKIIDVSEWQGVINWDVVKNQGNIDGVIIRLGYGSAYQDSQFKRNVSECRRLGIPFGVYLYSYALNGTEAKLEADFVADTLYNHGITQSSLAFPVYYDLEAFTIGATPIHVSLSQYEIIVANFMSTSASRGWSPHIYSYRNYLNTNLNSPNIWKYVSWAAAYGSDLYWDNPYYVGSFGWQYTSSGTIPGISGNVDVNCWYTK